MSYPELLVYNLSVMPKSTAPMTPLNLAATAAQWAGYAVLLPVSIKRAQFLVTTAVTAGLVAPQVAIKSRPTYGSATNAVTLVTMTIPSGSVVGTVVYANCSDNVRVQAGYELSFEGTVQATDSGTAAGAGFFGALYEAAPDADANQSLMVAAAQNIGN